MAATSPGGVRRAASGGAGLGARAPPARDVAADPGGRRGSRGLRAVPRLFLRNFQRCPAPRAGRCPGGSIVEPGLRLWGPWAQGAPPPAVTHSPATLPLFGSGVAGLCGHLAPAARSPPLRLAPASPPAGFWTSSLRPGPCPGPGSPRAASSAGCVLLCRRPSHSRRRPLRLGPGPRRVPGSPGSPSSRRPRRAENSQLAARAPLRRLSPLLTRDPRPAAEAARPGFQPQADPALALRVRPAHAGKPLAPGTRDSGRGLGGLRRPVFARILPGFSSSLCRAPPGIRSEDPLPGLRGPRGQVGRVLRAQERGRWEPVQLGSSWP